MTHRDPDEKLEQLIHERLRALPDLEAPRQLIPAVLRKLAERKTMAWWKRPWLYWPRKMQLLSAALLIAVGAGAWFLGGNQFGATGAVQFLRPAWTFCGALLGALHAIMNSIPPAYLIVGASAVIFLYLSTLSVGALCYRVAIVPKSADLIK
jgi:hypothetical protein